MILLIVKRKNLMSKLRVYQNYGTKFFMVQKNQFWYKMKFMLKIILVHEKYNFGINKIFFWCKKK